MPDTATATAAAPATFTGEEKASKKKEHVKPTPLQIAQQGLKDALREIVLTKGKDQLALRRGFTRRMLAGEFSVLVQKGTEFRVGIRCESGTACSIPPVEWALLGATGRLQGVGTVTGVDA